MIEDLTKQTGIPMSLDTETLKVKFGIGITYLKEWSKTLGTNNMSNDALWKSLRLAKDYINEEGDTISQPILGGYWNPDSVLYCGYQGSYWENEILQDLIKGHKLRPDITILPPGTVGDEYLRTEGHHHLSGLPEIYETVYGRNGYLLFKTAGKDSEDIEDVFFVLAEEGDHVLFPPSYQHISINIGECPFLMADWVSTEANSNFEYIKKRNGAPYWVVKSRGSLGIEKNPRYERKVPPIRLVKPAEEVELSHGYKIKKGEPMFSLVKNANIGVLDFLNETTEHDFYKRAFVGP